MTSQRMGHIYLHPSGLTYDNVNAILRPGKRRFGSARHPNPRKFMISEGKRLFGKYQNPTIFKYENYVFWDSEGSWTSVDSFPIMDFLTVD